MREVSLSQCLQNDALGSLAIPFAVEDALPGTEIEPARGDGDDDLVADGQRPEMGGGVVFARSGIVPIPVGFPWRDVVLEPVENVLPETGFMIVDEHGG